MRTMSGDLIELALLGEFDVIVHGCNCCCTMGAGIAKQIQLVFPEAYEADLKTKRGDRTKLGTISFATVEINKTKITIVNAYTQFGFGRGKLQTDYSALRSAMKEVKLKFSGKKIGYPKIGAGLGGGNWCTIAGIIDEELDGEDHILVEYNG